MMRSRIEDHDVPCMPDASARGPDVTASWISPENLDSEHLSVFIRALSNVLSTALAEETYAQIVDGLPTRDSYSEFGTFYPAEGEHPAYNHRRLCDGALDAARCFLSRLDPLTLRFDPRVLQAFQAESPASLKFLLRVVELLAISLHEIAVHLFELHQSLHEGEYDDWWASWRQRYRDAEGASRFHAVAFPPVPFHHNFYRAFDQYPRGRADMVGYWAESKILGGVALFDRGPSDLECNQLLIHGSLRHGPMTIYPLTDSQWRALASFLTSDAAAAAAAETPCPLPLRATSRNLPRYTPYFAMKYQHIFRDRFAFRLPARFEYPDWRAVSDVDYPEREDSDWVVAHMLDRYQGKPIDEEEMARRTEVLRSCQPGNPYSQAPWPDEILKGEGMGPRGKKNDVWY